MNTAAPIEKKTIYEKVAHESVTIIGIDVITHNKDDKAVDDINSLWQRFITEGIIERIPGSLSPEYVYAVYTDYEGDHEQPYRLIIGCAVAADESAPEGMVKHTIPAATYALFRSRGEQPRSLIRTWETIWASDLKRSFTSDFEVYGPRFYEPGLHEVLIHLSISDENN